MALTRRRSGKAIPGTKPVNGYILPTDKLEQREKVFALYRDFGKARSISMLLRELKHHPELAVTRPTLEKWSQQHQWVERCEAHDAAIKASLQDKSPQFSPELDQVGKLMQAAHSALIKALSGTPIVTKAGDMKALIDASANALKLADSIKAKQAAVPPSSTKSSRVPYPMPNQRGHVDGPELIETAGFFAH
jgi:hypothetical protein